MATDDSDRIFGQARLVAARFECLGRNFSLNPWGKPGFSGARIFQIQAGQGIYCLRRWPQEHPSLDRLEFIHGVLKHASRAGIQVVAEPLPDHSGKTIVQADNTLWELTRWLPGEASYHAHPHPRKLESAMEALASFHLAAAKSFGTQHRPSRGLAQRYRQTTELQKLERGYWIAPLKRIDWVAFSNLALSYVTSAEFILRYLSWRLAPFAGRDVLQQPCIRDVWHDHLLFSGNELTGIVDYGAMRFESVAGDLARSIGSLVGDDLELRSFALQCYERHRPLSDTERELIEIFDDSGVVLSGFNWMRWISVEQRVFPDRAKVEERFAELSRRLGQLAARIRRNPRKDTTMIFPSLLMPLTDDLMSTRITSMAAVYIRPQEEILIHEALPIAAPRVLCTTAGSAQFADHYATEHRDSSITCHFFDIFPADIARRNYPWKHLTIECSADFPDSKFDLCCLPLSSQGNAELTREMLQEGHRRLVVGGRMIVTTDNPDDTWLHEEMRRLFAKVSRRHYAEGTCYAATKSAELKKVKRYDCEYAFRDRDRLIQVWSRAGVFSHRHLDVGARALIESVEVAPGTRALELGCGCGAVSFAIAMRAPNVQVVAIDSNARAVQCTARGAQLNGIERLTTRLDAEANVESAKYDLVVANPPYYSGFIISALFLQAAERALVPGGVLQCVTKHPQLYEENMPAGFEQVTITPVRQYFVVRAVRR